MTAGGAGPLDALRGFLRHVTAGNPRMIIHPYGLQLAMQLAQTLDSTRVADNAEAWSVIATLHWWRSQSLAAEPLPPADQDSGWADGSQDRAAALWLFGELLPVDASLVPDEVRAMASPHRPAAGPYEWHHQAVALLADPASSADPAKIDTAVGLLRRAVAALREGHEHRPLMLADLASVLLQRFELSGRADDLDEAVELVRAATSTEAGDGQDADRLALLFDLLTVRWEHFDDRRALDEAIEVGRRAAAGPTEERPGRGGRATTLSNLGRALRMRAERSGSREDFDAATAAIREAVAATPADHPGLARRLVNLAMTLDAQFGTTGDPRARDDAITTAVRAMMISGQRFAQSNDLAALGEAVMIGVWAVERVPPDHAALGPLLDGLAQASRERYTIAGQREDLERAVDADRRVLAVTAPDAPEYAYRLFYLSGTVWMRYRHSADRSDLDEAIDTGYRAAAACTGPPPARYLSNLSGMLRMRFEQYGDPQDLDDAVQAGRRAVPSDSFDLNLACALVLRYAEAGAEEDFQEAATALQRAFTATSDAGERAEGAGVLVTLHQVRYERTGRPEDLDSLVAAARQAVVVAEGGSEDYRFTRLAQLGEALETRFHATRTEADRDEMIERLRQAAGLRSAPGAERSSAVGRLASALAERFEESGGSDADLDEAVDLGRSALAELEEEGDATDPGHDRLLRLLTLSNALQLRYQRRGVAADLDEAVALLRELIAGAPNDASAGVALTNLGNALTSRFGRFGAMEDLDAAVTAGRRAVTSDPEHGADHEQLSSLSFALMTRFTELARPEDLDEGIDYARKALAAVPAGHANRSRYLSNLAGLLAQRFTLLEHGPDLDEAVTTGRQAIAAAPPGRPERPGYQANLGAYLMSRFRAFHDLSDCDAALERFREALAGFPEDHPDRAALLLNIAHTAGSRSEISGSAADRQAALDGFREATAVTSAAALWRARAALGWARLAVDDGQTAQAVEATRIGLRLLPMLVDRGLSGADQRRRLGEISGLASLAAWATLSTPPGPAETDHLDTAWVRLEAGRGVLLSQALALRDDLTEISAASPELAERIRGLRVRLSLDAEAKAGPETDPSVTRRRRADLAREWEETVEAVRRLPGHERFGLPPTIEQLREAVTGGTAVALVLTSAGAAALVLTARGSSHVPLPRLDPEDAVAQVQRFLAVVEGGPAATDADDLKDILAWLWDVVAEPVLQHLAHDRTPVDGVRWPRVWWLPTGALSLLPIHAAGYHDDEPGPDRRAVVDRVVSSYTPTIRALHRVRMQGSDSAGDPARTVIVGLNDVADDDHGVARLRYAEDEALLVRRRLNATGPALLGSAATIATVTAALEDAVVAHFACHGVVDALDPVRSHLLLHDGAMSVDDLNRLDLREAQLAFLSACSTAFGAGRLPDEAIHLASAFQLAGFTHTVAALWPIDDALAPYITANFYGRRMAGMDPANAMHDTVRLLRAKYPDEPGLWAAYVHFGP
jgi:tetratricopeptide (TPR) repeat protein